MFLWRNKKNRYLLVEKKSVFSGAMYIKEHSGIPSGLSSCSNSSGVRPTSWALMSLKASTFSRADGSFISFSFSSGGGWRGPSGTSFLGLSGLGPPRPGGRSILCIIRGGGPLWSGGPGGLIRGLGGIIGPPGPPSGGGCMPLGAP